MSDQDTDYIEHVAEDAAESRGTGLVLPDQNLPDKLYLLPINNRPFFPAQVMPVVVNESPWHETIERVANTQHKALSLFYTVTQMLHRPRPAGPRGTRGSAAAP